MKKYFESLSLVELNSTFYNYPQERTVEGWREKAPAKFEFTVKAHQHISHKAKLKADEACLQAFERMVQICKTLHSKRLLIQTPSSFRPDKLAEAERFFRKVNRRNLTFVWETRGSSWSTEDAYKKLRQTAERLNVTHVTDPLRAMPAYTGRAAYFRLHGLGERMYYYQHSDAELKKLKQLITPFERESKEVYVLFNNLTMFDDALRFKQYLSAGTFPRITSSYGLASIREVAAKTRYPASTSLLMKKLGWKLVEVEQGKQVRLAFLLDGLPRRTYKSAEELVDTIKSVKKMD
jgi:uncharacterized protein YecE (DUF72 family)